MSKEDGQMIIASKKMIILARMYLENTVGMTEEDVLLRKADHHPEDAI